MARCSSAVRPEVPLVSTWQDVAFTQPVVGWHELATLVASKSLPPHPSSNALRIAFWAGSIPLRAVRYGQLIIFDGARVNAWVRRGGYRPRRESAR